MITGAERRGGGSAALSLRSVWWKVDSRGRGLKEKQEDLVRRVCGWRKVPDKREEG